MTAFIHSPQSKSNNEHFRFEGESDPGDMTVYMPLKLIADKRPSH